MIESAPCLATSAAACLCTHAHALTLKLCFMSSACASIERFWLEAHTIAYLKRELGLAIAPIAAEQLSPAPAVLAAPPSRQAACYARSTGSGRHRCHVSAQQACADGDVQAGCWSCCWASTLTLQMLLGSLDEAYDGLMRLGASSQHGSPTLVQTASNTYHYAIHMEPLGAKHCQQTSADNALL